MNWRLFLIGAGAIAHQHAKAAKRLGEVEIFAADPFETARANFAAAFPQATLFDNPTAMLASSAAQSRDIVVVAVPPWLHKDAALEAIGSGRHVLIEKPVARTMAEFDAIRDAAARAKVYLGDCSVRFLVGDALPRARGLLAGGGIGRPYPARLVNRRPRSRPGIEYQPSSTWFLDKDKSGGGAIFDWGVYDLTMFFDVLRPVAAEVHSAWLAAPRTAIDPPDHPISIETHAGASMTLTLEDRSRVSFDYERGNGLHGEPQATLNVDGTEGGLTWQWCPPFEDNIATLTHHVDVGGKIESRTERFGEFGWEEVHAQPLLAFAARIEGRQSVILPEARLAFNFGVMSAIYVCAETSRPVEVRLEV